MPYVLEDAVDVHLFYAQRIKVQHALADVRNVGTAYRHLGAAAWELAEPQWDVAHNVIIRPTFGLAVAVFPHPVEVVLAACAVDGDAYRQMVEVLTDEPLHRLGIVIDAVGRKTETVGIEPVVAAAEHLHLQVVADAVDKFYFEERFSADEVENHRLGVEYVVMLVVEDVVDGRFCHLPRHPLLLVLSHQVAIFAGQLAVLGHDKRDALGHSRLPTLFILFYFHQIIVVLIDRGGYTDYVSSISSHISFRRKPLLCKCQDLLLPEQVPLHVVLHPYLQYPRHSLWQLVLQV